MRISLNYLRSRLLSGTSLISRLSACRPCHLAGCQKSLVCRLRNSWKTTSSNKPDFTRIKFKTSYTAISCKMKLIGYHQYPRLSRELLQKLTPISTLLMICSSNNYKTYYLLFTTSEVFTTLSSKRSKPIKHYWKNMEWSMKKAVLGLWRTSRGEFSMGKAWLYQLRRLSNQTWRLSCRDKKLAASLQQALKIRTCETNFTSISSTRNW